MTQQDAAQAASSSLRRSTSRIPLRHIAVNNIIKVDAAHKPEDGAPIQPASTSQLLGSPSEINTPSIDLSHCVRPVTAPKISRADSGYASQGSACTPPLSSPNTDRSPVLRRTTHQSTVQPVTTSTTCSRPRTARPSTRRSTHSFSSSPTVSPPIYLVRSRDIASVNTAANAVGNKNYARTSYFHFPSLEPPQRMNTASPSPTELSNVTASTRFPHSTTHYWTSDSTRRLEYAAIDAASRGIKGWVKRNLIPDCFLPQGKHLAFDDDSGSVRRYRLVLEDEQEPQCTAMVKANSAPTLKQASYRP